MTVSKQLARALIAAVEHVPDRDPQVLETCRAALDAYKESEEFKRERIDEGIRSASAITNKLDDDMQELLTNVSLLTDSEEILLRSARNLIAEAADHINKILDPDA